MLNIEHYLQRIDYHGETTPSLNTLNALTQAHSTHIPFENISVLLKQPILLDETALFNKLVTQRRGGYCFEQNGLFYAILKQLGFNVRTLAARVRLAYDDRNILPMRTHLLVAVRINDSDYISDVGVGACSLTQALELVPDNQQETPHDSRRLQQQNNQWYLQIRYDDHWQDVYQFGGEAMPRIDREVANWYTSTHPSSHFTYQLSVAIANKDGSRTTLKDKRLTVRGKDGTNQQTLLKDNTQLMIALRQHFGIQLGDNTNLFNQLTSSHN